MAVRVREDGSVVCAAMHPARKGDVYVDDGLHYRLSVELGLLVSEPMEGPGGLGGHAAHGRWWWRGCAPEDAELERR